MNNTTNVILSGLGRAGLELARTIHGAQEFRVIAGICRQGSANAGSDVGELAGIGPIGAPVLPLNAMGGALQYYAPDAVVDFSTPEATLTLARACRKRGVNLIVGTTGFSEVQLAALRALAASRAFALLYAPNITLGVNVLLGMVNYAARHLAGYDFQITEIHHKNKKDAPSGTANMISHTIHTGLAAASGNSVDVPITSIRAGGYVGRHEVLAVGENDKIVIIHESFSRKAFAEGAMLALRGIQGRTGWLEMGDIIH